MPTVSEMTAGRFLTKEECDPAIVVTIKGFASEELKSQSGIKTKWIMSFNELQKPMVLNKVNIKRCAKIFNSDDTDDWIGKKIMLYNDPEVMMGDEMIGGIRVRSAGGTKPKPATKHAESQEDLDSDIPF